jgi:hypothetical protein
MNADQKELTAETPREANPILNCHDAKAAKKNKTRFTFYVLRFTALSEPRRRGEKQHQNRVARAPGNSGNEKLNV